MHLVAEGHIQCASNWIQDAFVYTLSQLHCSLIKTNCLFTRHYTYIDEVIEESHTICHGVFLFYFCFLLFAPLYRVDYEQHAIETRGLISINRAFRIEMTTKKENVALFPLVIIVHFVECVLFLNVCIEFVFRHYSN